MFLGLFVVYDTSHVLGNWARTTLLETGTLVLACVALAGVLYVATRLSRPRPREGG